MLEFYHVIFLSGCAEAIYLTYTAYVLFNFMQVWDFSSYLNALAESETAVNRGDNSIHRHSPIIKFTGHKDEGYAIDWSPVVTGRLVSGMSIFFKLFSV